VLPKKIRFIWLLGFRGEDFLEKTRKKNCLWWPCLLTDRDEMSNLYKGPSMDASYQVSIHLAKRFQYREEFFELDQSETRIASGRHVCLWFGTKLALVIVHLAKWF